MYVPTCKCVNISFIITIKVVYLRVQVFRKLQNYSEGMRKYGCTYYLCVKYTEIYISAKF